MTPVFVYGTLKRGGSNHALLAGQSFCGAARTVPGYTLYELAGYPGLVPAADDRAGVHGEVWRVTAPCLAALDELEGTEEGLYRRGTIALLPPFDGQAIEAYFYLRDVGPCRKIGPLWDQAAGSADGA